METTTTQGENPVKTFTANQLVEVRFAKPYIDREGDAVLAARLIEVVNTPTVAFDTKELVMRTEYWVELLEGWGEALVAGMHMYAQPYQISTERVVS